MRGAPVDIQTPASGLLEAEPSELFVLVPTGSEMQPIITHDP